MTSLAPLVLLTAGVLLPARYPPKVTLALGVMVGAAASPDPVHGGAACAAPSRLLDAGRGAPHVAGQVAV